MFVSRFIIVIFGLLMVVGSIHGQEWPPPNRIDLIQERMDAITADNCQDALTLELRLPSDTLSHLPTYPDLSNPDHIVPENRSNLAFIHNLALNRGFFFSFINSKLSEVQDFTRQPDWLYYYTSVWSDVAMSSGLNHSGIFYDQNKTYANWYPSLPFNKTLGLFGPRAWRHTDCDYEFCESLEESLSSDYGAGLNNNYTSPSYKHNPWYNLYLPDNDPSLDNKVKLSYTIRLKLPNAADYEYHTFFGVSLLGEDQGFLPVVYTPPYFDCERSNQWIVGAVSPFVDYIPRYLEWSHLRRHMFVGISVVELDYKNVDINPCPLSLGNEAPNYFAGTAICKSTTWCDPLSGFGFQRGGYQCHCNPGLVYPEGQTGPFQGNEIENATREEYEQGFDCINPAIIIHDNYKEKDSSINRSRRVKRNSEWHSQDTPSSSYYDKEKIQKLNSFLNYAISLELPHEFAYNANIQFEMQSKMAVRLSHFLSSYLQTASPGDGQSTRDDPGFSPDKYLQIDHIYGEVLANVMADTYVIGSGVYFDRDKFRSPDGESFSYFAPYATRGNETQTYHFAVDDAADFTPHYTGEEWFVMLKNRWENATELQVSELELNVRSNVNGDNVTTHPYSPVRYYTAGLYEGVWTKPYFKCKEDVEKWLITYATPFFGLDQSGALVEFHGVVTVDVLLDDLIIDQCDNSPYNAYSHTAKCNFQSSKCQNMGWRGMKLGGYRCVCLTDDNKFVNGYTLELEYQKMARGLQNNFYIIRDQCQED